MCVCVSACLYNVTDAAYDYADEMTVEYLFCEGYLEEMPQLASTRWSIPAEKLQLCKVRKMYSVRPTGDYPEQHLLKKRLCTIVSPYCKQAIRDHILLGDAQSCMSLIHRHFPKVLHDHKLRFSLHRLQVCVV